MTPDERREIQRPLDLWDTGPDPGYQLPDIKLVLIVCVLACLSALGMAWALVCWYFRE